MLMIASSSRCRISSIQPPHIARKQADDRADDEAEKRARQRQQNDDVAAMHRAAEDVAAELIDAEGMRQAHARKRRAGSDLRRAVGRPERAR